METTAESLFHLQHTIANFPVKDSALCCRFMCRSEKIKTSDTRGALGEISAFLKIGVATKTTFI